jgi:DNA-binding HxlR family transcriptional regulator
VKSYGQYCPISRGAEIFAERWTPIIIRNLLVGCHTFGEIEDGAPGIPRSLLSQRLRLLERQGVLKRRTAGRRTSYHLTDCGHDLAEVCHALGVWGARWLEMGPEHLDPHLALWYWSRSVEGLPDRRVVVRFDIPDARPDRFWVVLDKRRTEVCVQSPGYDEDLVVRTDTACLVGWQTGAVSLAGARRDGRFRIDGSPSMVRAFGRWGGLSPFADVRPQSQGRAGSAVAPSPA